MRQDRFTEGTHEVLAARHPPQSFVVLGLASLIGLAVACGSGSTLPLAANYEGGWKDGLSTGHCGLLEEDNCGLYFRLPEWRVSDWSIDEWDEVTGAYQSGYNDGANRTWDCAEANGLAIHDPRQPAIPNARISTVNNRIQSFNASWDGYNQCRARPHDALFDQ